MPQTSVDPSSLSGSMLRWRRAYLYHLIQTELLVTDLRVGNVTPNMDFVICLETEMLDKL